MFRLRKIREDETNNLVTSPSSLSNVNISPPTDKRFAYSLLEKLLEYVERASSTMQNYKESSKFSLHESYRLSTKDVKFFGKVFFRCFVSFDRSMEIPLGRFTVG